jgi:hypothetical protein
MSRESRMMAGVLLVVLPSVMDGGLSSPAAKQPNGLINLAYVGALFLAAPSCASGWG